MIQVIVAMYYESVVIQMLIRSKANDIRPTSKHTQLIRVRFVYSRSGLSSHCCSLFFIVLLYQFTTMENHPVCFSISISIYYIFVYIFLFLDHLSLSSLWCQFDTGMQKKVKHDEVHIVAGNVRKL